MDLPQPLVAAQPARWPQTEDGVTGIAGPATNRFISPLTGRTDGNAPMLLFSPPGDFIFSARVDADLASPYDAGALLIFQNETHWAKLCLEYSHERVPMAVSVVTREASDDSNHAVLPDRSLYLRIARIGGAAAFHYSTTGGPPWQLARVFRLVQLPLQVGFLVQSPRGEGCEVRFREVRYSEQTLRDIRSGE